MMRTGSIDICCSFPSHPALVLTDLPFKVSSRVRCRRADANARSGAQKLASFQLSGGPTMDLMAPKMDQFLQSVSSLTGTAVHFPQVRERRAGHLAEFLLCRQERRCGFVQPLGAHCQILPTAVNQGHGQHTSKSCV